jgi:ParB family chromosome partitioning protein
VSDTFITVPLAKLRPAEKNIRKTGASAGIEELAASIAAHGLLQNLTVRPIAKNGELSDQYEVITGSRRLTALKVLAKRKTIRKDFPVPCHVLSDGSTTEVSLAENVVRAPMHPADQFEAFSALHAEGLGIADIGARFGISETVVEQRLKLAAVSPRLMDVYRKGEMNLDQLMAFAISDDHEAQERVWFESPQYDKHPQAIRRALTKALVEGADRRAKFIGAAAYEAAGGTIVRDLFQPENDGYFTDSQLLDRLVAEKLSAEAVQVKAEGWAWVEVWGEMDYGYLARLTRLPPVPLSAEDEARLTELADQYDRMIEELGEEPAAETDAELARLMQEIDTLSESRMRWSPEDIARAGAAIALDYEGVMHIQRGLVKPESRTSGEAPEPKETQPTEGAPPKRNNSLSDAVIEDLTAQRTVALQEMVAGQPELALTALLHTLVLCTFYGDSHVTCLDITPRAIDLRPFSEKIGESRAALALYTRRQAWLDRLPGEEALWPWLMGENQTTKLELLAYCAAVTLNAVKRKHEGDGSRRLQNAACIADAAGLDMADWWETTKDSYLGRVSKALILEAVTEGVSKQAAENIATLKKDAMAARAEERLAGKRWLPNVLRRPSLSPDGMTSNPHDGQRQ